jgi:hypothetical protein
MSYSVQACACTVVLLFSRSSGASMAFPKKFAWGHFIRSLLRRNWKGQRPRLILNLVQTRRITLKLCRLGTKISCFHWMNRRNRTKKTPIVIVCVPSVESTVVVRYVRANLRTAAEGYVDMMLQARIRDKRPDSS